MGTTATAQPSAPASAAGDPEIGRSIRAAGILTNYHDLGEGFPALFIHGSGPGVSAWANWRLVLAPLSQRMRVIAPDMAGFGFTERRADIRYDMDTWVAQAVGLLDALGIEQANIVGNSFGGHVALRVAHARPELVSALVLAGSSGLIERTVVKGAPVRPSREWLVEKIGELFYDKSKMHPGDVDRAYALLNERGGARAMVKLSKTARRDNMTDDLGDIHFPTLLIWGKQDVVTPPSAGQGFAELMPNARLAWLDNCGHAPMIESPDGFARAMHGFFDELQNSGFDFQSTGS